MGPIAKGLAEGTKSHLLASKLASTNDATVVTAAMEELQADEPKIRNMAVKTLAHLASHRPEWLLPHLAFFLEYLHSDSNIFKWGAMDIAGHLAKLDDEALVNDDVIAVLVEALEDESMVTAAHGVENIARIAQSRPKHHSRLLADLFRVESIPRAPECREVLLVKVADGLGRLLPSLSEVNRSATLTFLNRLAMSDGRAGVKASKILRRLER